MTQREFPDYLPNLDADELRTHVRQLLRPLMRDIHQIPDWFEDGHVIRCLLHAAYVLSQQPDRETSRTKLVADAQLSILGAMRFLNLIDEKGSHELQEEIAAGKYRTRVTKGSRLD